MEEYKIRESGKNGVVAVYDNRLERTIKKRLGKDDRQTIPMKQVTSVHHDRKLTKTDQVRLQVGVITYTWKVSKADAFVASVNQKLAEL